MMKIHVVRKGDTLYDIAQKYGVDLDVLIAANPQIDDPDVLMIGQKIRIPSKGVADAPPRQSEPKVEAAVASDGESKAVSFGSEDRDAERGALPNNWDKHDWNHDWDHDNDDDDDHYFRYTVRPGDTLWEIAHRFGLSLQELIAANPQIENPDLIQVGQVIRVPRRRAPMAPMPPYGPAAPYSSYGNHDAYPMPQHPMMPPYPAYPPYSGYFPWGFQWSFMPPSGESGTKQSSQGQQMGPWTPFTVWVPYEHSFPFYTDMMPGGYGHYPAAPYGASKDGSWSDKGKCSCQHPKKTGRGVEREEQAEA